MEEEEEVEEVEEVEEEGRAESREMDISDDIIRYLKIP